VVHLPYGRKGGRLPLQRVVEFTPAQRLSGHAVSAGAPPGRHCGGRSLPTRGGRAEPDPDLGLLAAAGAPVPGRLVAPQQVPLQPRRLVGRIADHRLYASDARHHRGQVAAIAEVAQSEATRAVAG